MRTITSIYIPRIDTRFNARFISYILDKNGIAQVSSVYIEPYKSIKKNNNGYNRAYIYIKSWHDTESAFNFIVQLRNPSREARIVYNDDNWWAAYINKYPPLLASNKCVLTLFEEKLTDFYNEDISSTAVLEPQPLDMIKIDIEKTELLRNIVANFKSQVKNKDDDAADFDNYSREIDEERKNLLCL